MANNPCPPPATKIDFTTKCPCCHHALESNDHFLICNEPIVVDAWKIIQIQILYDTLVQIELDPILSYYIIQSASTWKTFKQPRPLPEFCVDNYYALYLDQCKLGWSQVLYGWLTKKWVDIKNQYNINNKLDGVAVITKTVKAMY